MDPIVLVDVDDADTRIQYSDGWSTGTNRNAYGRTLHYAQLAGITATLTFNGTLHFSCRRSVIAEQLFLQAH